jgi:hypothetical protein
MSSAIAKLTRGFDELGLSSNMFEGTIPPSHGQLMELIDFYLNFNIDFRAPFLLRWVS